MCLKLFENLHSSFYKPHPCCVEILAYVFVKIMLRKYLIKLLFWFCFENTNLVFLHYGIQYVFATILRWAIYEGYRWNFLILRICVENVAIKIRKYGTLVMLFYIFILYAFKFSTLVWSDYGTCWYDCFCFCGCSVFQWLYFTSRGWLIIYQLVIVILSASKMIGSFCWWYFFLRFGHEMVTSNS